MHSKLLRIDLLNTLTRVPRGGKGEGRAGVGCTPATARPLPHPRLAGSTPTTRKHFYFITILIIMFIPYHIHSYTKHALTTLIH